MEARVSCPLSDRLRYAAMLDQMVIASVVALFYLCGPSAVVWSVISVDIATINGHLRIWSRTHVCIKGFERVLPAIAHDNSASTIVKIGSVLLVVATLLDLYPDPVF